MPDGLIEFQRFRHAAALEPLLELLQREGIEYHTSSTAPNFDITTIGTDSDAEVIVSIRHEDFSRAHALLESISLESPLPDDHHLHTASDDELMEILSHENEWSSFDVAHARRLARERNIDPDRIAALSAQRLTLLREGKQAPRLLVLGGFALAIIGACGFPFFSIGGIGIAWSLLTMKNTTPEGIFPHFDAPSRSTGFVLLWFSLIAGLIGLTGLIFQTGWLQI